MNHAVRAIWLNCIVDEVEDDLLYLRTAGEWAGQGLRKAVLLTRPPANADYRPRAGPRRW